MATDASRTADIATDAHHRDAPAVTFLACPETKQTEPIFSITENLPDPWDLAQLRTVSGGMRAAVDAT